jgi:RNA-directed DNA polymerase
MKRASGLFPRVSEWDALLAAARRAARGKRDRPEVAGFLFDLEERLLSLQARLRAGTWTPSPCRTLAIREPKPRVISIPPFEDRVVHQAVSAVLGPVLERGMIHDSYACRRGKGSHRALLRASSFARRFRFVLKADVRKYFPSIDHEVLRGKLRRRIKDAELLALLNRVIDASAPGEQWSCWFAGDDLLTPATRPHGLPIGSLLSQHFAVFYLDSVDHLVKEELRLPGYLRYMDDFLLFADDKARLWEAQAALSEHLAGLRLRLNPDKTVLRPTVLGFGFCGFKVLPTHRLLLRSNKVRQRRRLKQLAVDCASGAADAEEVRQSVGAWLAHARWGSTVQLRRQLLSEAGFPHPDAESRPW